MAGHGHGQPGRREARTCRHAESRIRAVDSKGEWHGEMVRCCQQTNAAVPAWHADMRLAVTASWRGERDRALAHLWDMVQAWSELPASVNLLFHPFGDARPLLNVGNRFIVTASNDW